MLKDVSRAASLYSTPVHGAALQVYDSVLATMPTCELFKRWSVTIEDIPMLISPRSESWRPEELILEGHHSDILSVAFSRDGKHIASGSWDKTVRVWNAATGTLEHTLSGHDNWVSSVAFSTDGKHIASGSLDQTVRVWNAATGTLEHTLSGHDDWVRSVAFSTDGKHIASGSHDKTVRVWNPVTGALCGVIENCNDSLNVSTLLYTPQFLSGLSCNCSPSSTYDSLPGTLATAGPVPSSLYKIEDSGWIRRYNVFKNTWERVCWLPNQFRNYPEFAHWGDTVVVGAASGAVTILDFSRVQAGNM
jgi:WD40 repeat protein